MTLQNENFTAQDLARFGEEPGIEYVDGQIVEKNVSRESSLITRQISTLLGNWSAATRLTEVYDCSLGYQCFADDPTGFCKPDVSAIKSERLKGMGDVGLMPIPADLVVEVISPQDNAFEVNNKIERYLANGFKLLWIVYPETRTVFIHRSDTSVTKLHEQDQITGETVLPGFACNVAEFFTLVAAQATV